MSRVQRVSEPDAATLPCAWMDSRDTIGYSWRVCRFREVLILRFCRSALVVLGLPARQEAHLRSLEKESWVNCARTISSPMSPNVIHSYPILTLFGDSWWFLMLMPSFFVLVVCKPQAYPESSFRTWCSYPSLWFVGSVEFWSLGFVGLHLLSWLAGLPGSASTERGEGELGELCWDNVHVFFWIECWLVERFRGFQNLFTRAPVDFGWWGSRSLDWF